ncbi:MAG: methylenetetrahydrofolate dehydrogenase (NADP+) / methenyltetrahydrofolate cyclohydrolase [Comamonadaceae bacterium]|nr:MAG: methylenetetrahydrofolate dehydrogenase (NADP+) / methenyltetrahydrofolate cyclohydrolase [Comamonadaceae bacterium]
MAAGKPGLIVPQMVRRGEVVIDVDINRLPDGRIVGDVDIQGVKKKASWITPVPGARCVGPMTVTMLIKNTLSSAHRLGGEGAGIGSIADGINNRPRQTLGWASPIEVYRQWLERLEVAPESIQ